MYGVSYRCNLQSVFIFQVLVKGFVMLYIKNICGKLKIFFLNAVQQIRKGSCAYILCTVFFVFCIINLLWPSNGFSHSENRALSGFPSISAETITNGSFMSDFDAYCDDQLILRDFFVSLKAHVQLLTFKTENNGVYKAKDSYFINKPSYDADISQSNIDAIKNISDGGGLKVSVAIVPTAYQILCDKLPENTADNELISNLNNLNKGFEGSNVNVIDMSKALNQNRDEYIYYRTDHHQTAKGSFLSYTEIAKALGITPYTEKDFKVTEVANNFLGTNHSKFMLAVRNKDSILSYELKQNKPKITLTLPESDKKFDSLYIKENLDKKDKYTYYMNGNHGVHIVNTDVDNGKKLVVFKDSYAHSIVPFLANHYEEIHMIDLRYFNDDVFEYMYKNKLSNILFLYNSSNFASDSSLAKIAEQEKTSPYGEVRYGYVEYTKAVDDAYFADAVFVGDSLTEGMRMYSGINAGEFYTKVGVSLYNADTLCDMYGVNIFESINSINANKMYIMLGINQELDSEHLDGYIKMYGDFIDAVREKNSEITIYIQSVMPVSRKAEQRSGILAQNIQNANKALNRLAIDKCCYYLGVNEIATDEEGYMLDGISPDGIHLSVKKCMEWYDYLKHHTVSYSFENANTAKSQDIKFSGNSKVNCDEIANNIINNLSFTYDMNKVSDGLIYNLYKVKTEFLKSAAVYMSSGAVADEVTVFELDPASGTDENLIRQKITDHINARIDQMEDYNPQEVKKLKNAVVYVKDGVAVLCVCNNPKEAEKKIADILG